MAEGAIYLTETEVASLVDLIDAINALEDACARQGRRELPREFIDRFGGPDSGKWEAVQTLADVIAGRTHPTASGDLTLFKAMGMGISASPLCAW